MVDKNLLENSTIAVVAVDAVVAVGRAKERERRARRSSSNAEHVASTPSFPRKQEPITTQLKKCISFILLLTLCSIITACSPFKPIKQKSIETYVIEVDKVDVTKAPSNRKTLLVVSPNSVAGFDTAKMAYTTKPYELEYFTYNRWVDLPSNMILPLMVEALQKTGHFHAVVGAPYSGAVTYRLDTTIVRLRQNFLVKPSREELVIRASVINNATQRVIATKLFTIHEEVPFENPYGGVVATNRATKAYLQQLAKFVVRNT